MGETASRLRDAAVPAPWTVLAVRHDLADTFTLALAPVSGDMPAAAPGQFSMLGVPGFGDAAISVSGVREDRTEHTIRAVGRVTYALQRCRAGDVIGVRGPFGRGWPVHRLSGADVVVVAGGVGLAPLKPLVELVIATRPVGSRLAVYYGARTPHDLLFRDELETWRSAAEVNVTVDRATGAWTGHVGLVTQLLERGGFEPARTAALVCGPEVMMRHTLSALAARGVDGEQVWVSLERGMHCGTGTCGHCQLGPWLVCRDGPVFRADQAIRWLSVREL